MVQSFLQSANYCVELLRSKILHCRVWRREVSQDLMESSGECKIYWIGSFIHVQPHQLKLEYAVTQPSTRNAVPNLPEASIKRRGVVGKSCFMWTAQPGPLRKFDGPNYDARGCQFIQLCFGVCSIKNHHTSRGTIETELKKFNLAESA